MWLGDVNDVMHRKRAQRILENLRKVSLLSSALGEDGWLSGLVETRPVALQQLSHMLKGGDGKVSIERWYLSPYVEKPFNSKVIKSFVPELRSRKCFSCFGIPMFYVYMLWTFYVHFTYSHISGYGTRWHQPWRKTKAKETFLEMVEQQPNTITRTLSAEPDSSKSTINWQLHKLNPGNKRLNTCSTK